MLVGRLDVCEGVTCEADIAYEGQLTGDSREPIHLEWASPLSADTFQEMGECDGVGNVDVMLRVPDECFDFMSCCHRSCSSVCFLQESCEEFIDTSLGCDDDVEGFILIESYYACYHDTDAMEGLLMLRRVNA